MLENLSKFELKYIVDGGGRLAYGTASAFLHLRVRKQQNRANETSQKHSTMSVGLGFSQQANYNRLFFFPRTVCELMLSRAAGGLPDPNQHKNNLWEDGIQGGAILSPENS